MTDSPFAGIKGFEDSAEMADGNGPRAGRTQTAFQPESPSPSLMRTLSDSLSAQAEGLAFGASPDLSRVLLQGLNLPVTALRASMEALSQQISDRPDTSPILDGALAEVARIGRSVQDLLEYATPPEVHPLRCTIEEILVGATTGLDREARKRIDIAQDDRSAIVMVDGPLVSRNLRRLLENALEADANQILVAAQQHAGTTSFSVVDDGTTEFDPRAMCAPFTTTRPGHLGLGLALVERDARVLGGHLEISRRPGPTGRTCARMDLVTQAMEAAA